MFYLRSPRSFSHGEGTRIFDRDRDRMPQWPEFHAVANGRAKETTFPSAIYLICVPLYRVHEYFTTIPMLYKVFGPSIY